MKWPAFWSSQEAQQHVNNLSSQAKDSATKVANASHDAVEELKETASQHQHGHSRFTTTQTVGACILTTAATLGLLRLYKTHLRRIPSIDYLKPEALRKRSLYGYVTSVGDGDNFHLFHTPGGRLAGWRLFRTVSSDRKALQKKTLHVRIAGVDAPELAHFGRPAQPYGQEALDWLRGQVLHKYVRVFPWRKDQYDRVVCSVYRRRFGIFKADVGMDMLKAGMATVYEAKFGSEFGNKEQEYRDAEEQAKKRKVGMWKEPGLVDKMFGSGNARQKKTTESPREFKNRMKKMEEETGK
ncbi:Hypothetical predicted protein [Lecanosticta acicola]|uniref:Probable endonuclease LCL3 n=1 Tax=Lecanosticta acicola TaxID=111012 RepID=A0AAI9EEA8_9PEZI|nr:Hypothetical predicted protein [Lecanosticta acicola]